MFKKKKPVKKKILIVDDEPDIVTTTKYSLENAGYEVHAAYDGEEGLKLYYFGGYYNDDLIRTGDGWRISQRIEESSWNDGQP